MKKLTKKEFLELPFREIFDSGVLPNSPDGIYMTNNGGELRWVAVKGGWQDWSIYCHWSYHSDDWVKENGDKVCNINHIKKCVNCDPDVLKLYRY